jgi:hypothetical protein
LNIHEYIESGILERYALGQCNAEEIAVVEKALIQFPSLAEELQQIENALFLYAKTQEVTPPARVKKNVLAQIVKQSNTDTPVVNIVKSKNYSNWIAAASIVLLAGSIWLNFRLSQKNNSLQQEIASLQDQNSEIAGNLNFTKNGLNQSQHNSAFRYYNQSHYIERCSFRTKHQSFGILESKNPGSFRVCN